MHRWKQQQAPLTLTLSCVALDVAFLFALTEALLGQTEVAHSARLIFDPALVWNTLSHHKRFQSTGSGRRSSKSLPPLICCRVPRKSHFLPRLKIPVRVEGGALTSGRLMLQWNKAGGCALLFALSATHSPETDTYKSTLWARRLSRAQQVAKG